MKEHFIMGIQYRKGIKKKTKWMPNHVVISMKEYQEYQQLKREKNENKKKENTYSHRSKKNKKRRNKKK